ncbi:hypothetical protein TRM7557_00312 [Tritonibacter multivorans]|uniref:Dihydroorotate dehydrogenase n=1 Tax=Tritonibacter multivorans TaxID=928856 RepID=A0A0P1GM86_9RHOB|nr:hypothetical protein [Tritonibacter multivorans]MDA7419350.1 hypothetical protein [Tritonibacter multivorans]CUH75287.1 hypothetical protein TRM7557_00312 [Tritonibacter multivorans]SFD21652.1 hypothetical protein SAMN04488049_10949 [Tritonibacter multivorans]
MADQNTFKSGRASGPETGSDIGLDRDADMALEALFSEAQMQPPQMTQAFQQGLLADALAHMPPPTYAPAPTPAKQGLLAELADAYGGWMALGGSAGGAVFAGIVGLWLGIAPPAALEAMTANLSPGAASANADAAAFEGFDLAIVFQETAAGEEW